MIKIELKTEFGAHEITADDFDGSKRPDIKGVIWREPTRTVRLTAEHEEDDEVDEPDHDDERPPRRRYPKPNSDGVRPCSFYGIGCFIIVKNGRAIGIMSPKAFAAKYRSTT